MERSEPAIPVLRHLPHFVREVLSRFHHDRCMQLASSLTFTTLLAMVPLFTVSLMLLSVFPSSLWNLFV